MAIILGRKELQEPPATKVSLHSQSQNTLQNPAVYTWKISLTDVIWGENKKKGGKEKEENVKKSSEDKEKMFF